MDEEDTEPVVRRHSAEDTFALLSDETRIGILQALHEAQGETLSFSELREALGTPDSGRFNYHLSKLADHFIRKTETGYELTYAGRSVVGSLLAGTYTATAELPPIDVPDSRCLECGGPLRIGYEDEHVRIFCTDCEETMLQFVFPPGTFEQFDRTELPMALNRWIRTMFAQSVAGFCPNCSGRLDRSIDRDEKGRLVATYDCPRCGTPVTASIGATLLFEPAVISFAHENGVDLLETPFWELDWLREGNTTVVSTDPLAIRVRVTVGGDILDVTVDEELEVVEAVRQ